MSEINNHQQAIENTITDVKQHSKGLNAATSALIDEADQLRLEVIQLRAAYTLLQSQIRDINVHNQTLKAENQRLQLIIAQGGE